MNPAIPALWKMIQEDHDLEATQVSQGYVVRLCLTKNKTKHLWIQVSPKPRIWSPKS